MKRRGKRSHVACDVKTVMLGTAAKQSETYVQAWAFPITKDGTVRVIMDVNVEALDYLTVRPRRATIRCMAQKPGRVALAAEEIAATEAGFEPGKVSRRARRLAAKRNT